MNGHDKTKCNFCGLPVAKGVVRLRYWQSKSAMRYLHVECCNLVPEPRSLHSKACLRYQKDYGLAGHVDRPAVLEAIDKAVSLLP
jgi:hypothetical protein